MGRIFNTNERDESPMWIIRQIEVLLNESQKHNSSSKLFYACYETRNLLESIEFNYVFAALDVTEREDALKTIRKVDGIKKTFEDLDSSIYHYLTFLIELCNALKFPPPPFYDFKISRKFKTELNEYCHIYGRTTEELTYDSPFVKAGKLTIENVFKYLKETSIYYGATFIGTPISKLDPESKEVYNRWKSGKITKEQLTKEVVELIERKNKNTADNNVL